MDIDTSVEQEPFNTNKVAITATAHGLHDTYTAFLPALLPVIIERLSLTNTAAGLLSVFLQIPSLLQPVIGLLADRKNLKWLTILAPAVTGAAMSFLGIAPGYGYMIGLLLVAGISSAGLHAVTPGISSSFSGKQLGKGMSFWMVGGEIGRVLGPLIAVSALEFIYPGHLPWLMLGGIAASLFLYFKLNTITTMPTRSANDLNLETSLQKIKRIMMPVAGLILTRSMMTASLTTYLPTFLTVQGRSVWMAGASLTILQAAGMVGVIIVGSLSDIYGRRSMLLISYIATPVLMILFISTNGIFQIFSLILLGFSSISVVPVLLAIVHENAAENRSFANGIYMALSFVLNALSILLVGVISDAINLRTTFMISAGLLPLGIPILWLLPRNINSNKPESKGDD